MNDKLTLDKIGRWAFFGGVILAILLGFFPGIMEVQTAAGFFSLLGLIVGLFNISGKEVRKFLLAAAVLLLVGSGGLDRLPLIGNYLDQVVINLTIFVAPAAVIVALKAVLSITED